MNSHINKYLFGIFFILLLLFAKISAQNDIAVLESQLEQKMTLLQKFQQEQQSIVNLSDSLASQIMEMKKQGALNYFERNKLEKFLQQAQSAAERREQNIIEQKAIQEGMVILTTKLDLRYVTAIDSLMQMIEQSLQKDTKSRYETSSIINHYRSRRTQLQDMAGLANDNQTSIDLRPHVNDMPDEIEVRASFLRDRVDKWRRRADQANLRITQMRQEITLRKKMTELLDDVRLFDHQDEAVSVTKKTIKDAISIGETTKDFGGPARDATLVIDIASPMESLLKIDVRSVPIEEAGMYLQQLEKERLKLLFQADSLEHLANEYDQQAQKLRQNIHNPE